MTLVRIYVWGASGCVAAPPDMGSCAFANDPSVKTPHRGRDRCCVCTGVEKGNAE